MKKIVIGIDADITKVGLALIHLKSGKLLYSEKIVPDKSCEYFDRTMNLVYKFNKIIDSFLHKGEYKFVLVGIEDYGFFQIPKQMFLKGEIVGIIKRELLYRNIPIFTYINEKVKGKRGNKRTYREQCMIAPTQLKKFIFSAGNISTKDKGSRLLLDVYKMTGYEFDTDDEADAFMLAQMIRVYLAKLKYPKILEKNLLNGKIMNWNKKQMEPIELYLKSNNNKLKEK